MITLALVLIPFVAGGLIVWVSAKSAPEGFENEHGFHLLGETPARVRCADADYLPSHAKEEFALSA